MAKAQSHPTSGIRPRTLKPNQFLLPSGQLITEQPILFQTEMVQAILEDRKTQTRRTKGLDLINEDPEDWCFTNMTASDGPRKQFYFKHRYYEGDDTAHLLHCPYANRKGDLLWVKETFTAIEEFDTIGQNYRYQYLADYRDVLTRYSPSIHLPKAGSRIWLMVEDIRPERVQDISEEDAKAEGILPVRFGRLEGYKDPGGNTPCYRAKDAFSDLWMRINGQESWYIINPWVWRIQYRVLSKSGRPPLDLIQHHYQQVTSL